MGKSEPVKVCLKENLLCIFHRALFRMSGIWELFINCFKISISASAPVCTFLDSCSRGVDVIAGQNLSFLGLWPYEREYRQKQVLPFPNNHYGAGTHHAVMGSSAEWSPLAVPEGEGTRRARTERQWAARSEALVIKMLSIAECLTQLPASPPEVIPCDPRSSLTQGRDNLFLIF